MKQNGKKNEYGSVSLGITVEMAYDENKYRNGQEIKAKIQKAARLDIDPKFMKFEDSHTNIFAQIVDFQSGVNKMLRQARKLLTEGQYVEFVISTHGYEDVQKHVEYNQLGSYETTLNPLFFNSWSYKGSGQDVDMSSEGGLYLSADTRYTNESHDIWIEWGTDIFMALKEAGL